MESLLIVGVDSVIGANVAASLAERYNIATWAAGQRFEISGCTSLNHTDSPQELITQTQPDWILHCGAAAHSAWDPRTKAAISDEMVEDAHEWASLATARGSRFTMISSDAVFTSPWMFHDEDSLGQCHSLQALTIRAAEDLVRDACRDALIVRTNAFGWSPNKRHTGWVEQMLAEVEARRIVEQDHIRHATPILATDLADILDRAQQERLSGLFHISGAERVSPLKFAQRLADQFDLPWLALRRDATLNEPPQGFGLGECSLQTKKIRKALCVAMPLLSEGLSRLESQHLNGYRERLAGSAPAVQIKAA